MNGLHDVTLVSDSLKSDTTISINVVLSSGKAEEITLGVGELPAGVRATFSPNKGTPPFSTTLRLAKISSTKAGTYSVSINAKSASFSNSGTINLTIPESNGWTFDGIDHEQFFMPMLTNQGNPAASLLEADVAEALPQSGANWMVGFALDNPWDADGEYSYEISSTNGTNFYPTKKNQMTFMCINVDSTGVHKYYSSPSVLRNATIKVTGRKYSFTVPPTEMYEEGDTNRPMKILSVHAWMK